MVRISEAFSRIADRARGSDFSPVIFTDIYSAILLREMLEEDIGMRAGELRADGCVGMFDGVVITHPGWPLLAAWREHFGPLAEAFS